MARKWSRQGKIRIVIVQAALRSHCLHLKRTVLSCLCMWCVMTSGTFHYSSYIVLFIVFFSTGLLFHWCGLGCRAWHIFLVHNLYYTIFSSSSVSRKVLFHWCTVGRLACDVLIYSTIYIFRTRISQLFWKMYLSNFQRRLYKSRNTFTASAKRTYAGAVRSAHFQGGVRMHIMPAVNFYLNENYHLCHLRSRVGHIKCVAGVGHIRSFTEYTKLMFRQNTWVQQRDGKFPSC